MIGAAASAAPPADGGGRWVPCPRDFVAGWMGGVCGVALLHPFDTIKVRAQMQHISSAEAARLLAAEGGVAGLFKGVLSPVAGIGAARAAMFGAYGAATGYCSAQQVQAAVAAHEAAVWLRVEAAERREAGMGPAQYAAHRTAIALGLREDPAAAPFDPADLSMAMRNAAQLSPATNTACATVGGVAYSTVHTPFDVVKIRLQTAVHFDHRDYGGYWDCTRRLVQQGGVAKLWRGWTAAMARDVPFSVVNFGCYGLLASLAPAGVRPGPGSADELTGRRVAWSLLSGGVAGALAWLLIFPLDTVKVRIQSSGEFLRWRTAAAQIARRGGAPAFYRGLAPQLVRAFCSNAVCFAGVEAMLWLFRRQDARLARPPAGAGAGA